MADNDGRRRNWLVRWRLDRAERRLTAALAAALSDELAARALPGVASRVVAPGAWPAATPLWHWSACGRCGRQSRPGLPCGTCGWLLGACTPGEVQAKGLDLADAEDTGSPAAMRWHHAHGWPA